MKGVRADDKDVRRRLLRNCVLSIFGQRVFYAHSGQVNELVAPKQRLDAAGVAELAAHITAFSLRGLAVDTPTTAAPESPAARQN